MKKFLSLGLTLTLVFSGLVFSSGLVLGASTSLLSPSLNSNSGTDSDPGWEWPERAYVSDGSLSRANHENDDVQYYNFGFSIPTGVTIDGIRIRIEGFTTDARQAAVKLSWNNGSGWTSGDGVGRKLTTLPVGSGLEATISLGGTTDTWGRTWAAEEFADFRVRLNATNGAGNLRIDRVQARVWYTNTAPTLTDVPASETIPEEQPYTFDANATDPESPPQTLSFSLVGAPVGASIDSSTGVFSWTPTEAQGSNSYPFTVRVSDGIDNTDAAITLDVTEVNVAPVADDATVSTQVNTDEDITFIANDTDLPADTLTYSIDSGPSNGSLGPVSGNQVTYTPITDYVGSDSFSFLVDDGNGGTDTATISINITNSAPVILGFPLAASFDELTTYAFTANATDSDTDPVQTLTFSLSGEPVGASIDSSSGAFSWTPTEAQGPGIYSFAVEVSDGIYTDSGTVDLTVNEVPTAPVITLLGNNPENVIVGNDYTEPGYTATDAEDSDLTGLVIVTGSVDTLNNGSYELTYTVTDSSRLSDTQIRTVVVAPDENVGRGGPATPTGQVLGVTTSSEETLLEEQGQNQQEEQQNEGGQQGQVLGETTGPTCSPLLETFIFYGAANDERDVKDLQGFLNSSEGENLPITGFFGALSREAVMRFQAKYQTIVLGPWVNFGHDGVTPTGNVGKLTQWWINTLNCPDLNLPFPQLP